MRTMISAIPPPAVPKSSTRTTIGALCPTMAKRAALTMVSLRSFSPRRPAISAWIGAWMESLSGAGASCTSPSVIRIAPAMRSGGTSASAALSPAKSCVPLSSPVAVVVTTLWRTSRSFSPASCFLIAASAASSCALRSSTPMLCERSITTATTSGSGLCVSLTIRGLAMTKISAAKTSARAQAPRARNAKDRIVSAAAMAIAAQNRAIGTCGAKSTLRFTAGGPCA